MASAKKEAENYLGSVDKYIDLKGLNKERSIANQVYNTNRTTFQNAYNDLLNTIATNRQSARTQFGEGRSAVSEDAYMRDRQNALDLSSRGLRGGLVELGKLGNRMETGRQYSNLANTFYNTMNELDATQRTGENEYNTNLQQARNTLDAALADIGSREAAGRNAYKAQVAQLAEQIQARRDAAAAAAAQNRLLAQQYADARKAAEAEGIKTIQEAISRNNLGWAEASDYLVQNGLAKNTKAAIDWLEKYTTLRPTIGGYASPSGYKVRGSSTTKGSTGNTITNLLNLTNPSVRNTLVSSLFRRR